MERLCVCLETPIPTAWPNEHRLTLQTYNPNPNTQTPKTKTAYVVQDDVLFAFLTVRETLTLAAHFHLPPAMGEGEKVSCVCR